MIIIPKYNSDTGVITHLLQTCSPAREPLHGDYPLINTLIDIILKQNYL